MTVIKYIMKFMGNGKVWIINGEADSYFGD